jgi:hypothetical protein
LGSTDYEFRTVWRVAGTPEEVAAVLGEAAAMPRWWPSVYLSAEPVGGGPEPLLRRLSWLLKPGFAANHRWAMACGQESLALELRRRRAAAGTTLGGTQAVPPPPPPTFAWLARDRGLPGPPKR